jgi:hypothetical protein
MAKLMTLLELHDAIAKAIADAQGHGMREKCERHADAVLAVVGPQLLASAAPSPSGERGGVVDTPAVVSEGKCPDCLGYGQNCLAGCSAHPRNWYECETCGGSGKTIPSTPAQAAQVDDSVVASFVERAASVICGKSFPTGPALAKAREISGLALSMLATAEPVAQGDAVASLRIFGPSGRTGVPSYALGRLPALDRLPVGEYQLYLSSATDDRGAIGACRGERLVMNMAKLPVAAIVDKALDAQLLTAKNDARRVWQILEAAGVCNPRAALEAALATPVDVPDVVAEVLAELGCAMAKFPTWPTDPLHAMGVLNEEVGELAKAVLQQVYEPHKNKPGDVRKEAVQAAAMTLRFLASMAAYQFRPGEQHDQPALAVAPPLGESA